MVCIDFFEENYLKILPCVCFITLGGQQRCVESENGTMEQNSLRNTVLERTSLFLSKSIMLFRPLSLLRNVLRDREPSSSFTSS